MKSLDRKLKAIAKGKYTPSQFIIADAKDPDYSAGASGNGPNDFADPSKGHRGKPRFHADIRALIDRKQLDIMLCSVANAEALIAEKAFAKSDVTLAIRANDTTDIWLPRGGNYAGEPSRPFRSANLAHVAKFCDLGLYSITFNNILDADYVTSEAYARFRDDAVKHKVRHFLEVFNPNVDNAVPPDVLGAYVNDMIMRTLAGVAKVEKPLFLKMAFNGRRAMEELAAHDPALVIGILGGSAGTTRDTFELLTQAERSGARVALFGRKINLAESPLDLVGLFRPVIEGAIKPEAAVRAYHGELVKKKLKPKRVLAEDLKITESVLEGYRP